jgi:NAD(P)H-nitrite reductase large subunit
MGGSMSRAEDLDRIKRRARAAGVYLIEAHGPAVRKWKDKAGTNYIIQRGTLPKKSP